MPWSASAAAVVLAVAAGEDPGVDARVQRLDAAAEHLGHLRQRLDVRHLEPVLLEEARRSRRSSTSSQPSSASPRANSARPDLS